MSTRALTDVTTNGGVVFQDDLAGLAPLASPALTGNPTAPTQTTGNSSTRLATTAFVAAAVQAIVGMAPAELDTLAEIAASLETSEDNYAALVTTIAGKLQKDQNLADLVNASTALTNLGLTANGKSLVTAADYAAMRTLLGLGALATLASIATANIDNDAVTYAKIQNVSATARVLGRISGGAGDVEELTAANLKTILALAIADITGLQAAIDAKADLTDGFVTVSGTSHTVALADLGKVHRFTSSSAVTVTLPNSFPAGWNMLWRQVGTGQITFTPASGANRRNKSSHTKSSGQYAEGSLAVDSNSGGSAAEWYLSGDTAA